MSIEKILDLEQLENDIFRGSVFSPAIGQLEPHLRGPGGRSGAGFGGAHGRPALPGALAARLFPAAGQMPEIPDGVHRRTPPRRRLVRHPAGERVQHGKAIFRCRRRSRPTRAASSTRTPCPTAPPPDDLPELTTSGAFDDAGFGSSRNGTSASCPRRAGAPAGQGVPAAGVAPLPRPAARRPGHARLRAGLHERSDAARLGQGAPPRASRNLQDRVAGPRDVVPAAVPRRRVAALRPDLAVGVRRPGADAGPDLRHVRQTGGRRDAGGAAPAYQRGLRRRPECERAARRRAGAAGRHPRTPGGADGRRARRRDDRFAASPNSRPVDGLVLPGGESTTISRLLQEFELLEPLRARLEAACRPSARVPG